MLNNHPSVYRPFGVFRNQCRHLRYACHLNPLTKHETHSTETRVWNRSDCQNKPKKYKTCTQYVVFAARRQRLRTMPTQETPGVWVWLTPSQPINPYLHVCQVNHSSLYAPRASCVASKSISGHAGNPRDSGTTSRRSNQPR